MFDYQHAQLRHQALTDWALSRWAAPLGAKACAPAPLHQGHEVQNGTLLYLRAARDMPFRVLELAEDEHAELPLFSAVQQHRAGGTFAPGWQLSGPPKVNEMLLLLGTQKRWGLLVPTWAWWQAGFLLWETLLRLSAHEENPYRATLRGCGQPSQPIRLQGSARLPLSWWLRSLSFLTPKLDADSVLLATLGTGASAPAAVVKAFWSTQGLPALRLPEETSLRATLLAASPDAHGPSRHALATACAPAAMALCAQASYFESVHHAQNIGLSALRWEPLSGTEHLWPAQLDALHVRTAAVNPAQMPPWATVLAALQENYGAAQKEDLTAYFERHHH